MDFGAKSYGPRTLQRALMQYQIEKGKFLFKTSEAIPIFFLLLLRNGHNITKYKHNSIYPQVQLKL